VDATCPRCAAAFACGVDHPGIDPCWCAGVPLDPAMRESLAAAFTGCLCPTCLADAATAGAGSAVRIRARGDLG
jgi:hypothetical protein